ncbi:hypothetical protein [Limnoglobus roseus]|uniref:Uncharacterized protein n=1 Tax=Limnoglobus roseus TaxID=2598579 RepID=A0A5C1AFM1_9BACT|nr:hypothetical protein [Limnoglobus roseus]QEL16532.1 hypothetical protein PX52LOC_03491 [Limnoglobus roseus]
MERKQQEREILGEIENPKDRARLKNLLPEFDDSDIYDIWLGVVVNGIQPNLDGIDLVIPPELYADRVRATRKAARKAARRESREGSKRLRIQELAEREEERRKAEQEEERRKAVAAAWWAKFSAESQEFLRLRTQIRCGDMVFSRPYWFLRLPEDDAEVNIWRNLTQWDYVGWLAYADTLAEKDADTAKRIRGEFTPKLIERLKLRTTV